MFGDALLALATSLIGELRRHRLKLATAESCTGGLIAALLTEIPGASDVFERGFVTYSNAAKIGNLGVSFDLLLRHGAVSAEVASAMAAGAVRASAADLALSVTGIAGPGGGSPEKPVGLVYIGVCRKGWPARAVEYRFGDRGRSAVRHATIEAAIELALEDLGRA